MLFQTEASRKAWGAACRGLQIEGQWFIEEKLQTNTLIIKLALMTLTKTNNIETIQFQIDNNTVMCYLLKMGGTASPILNKISKEIWEIISKKNIVITGEYRQLTGGLAVQTHKRFLGLETLPPHFQENNSLFRSPNNRSFGFSFNSSTRQLSCE